MERRTPNFARILAPATQKGDGGFASLRLFEIDAVIELGFIMVNANGDASIDEIESFRALVKYLKPGADVASLIEEYDDKVASAASLEVLVREAAEQLTRPTARELAYKAVYAVSIFDLETNPHERALEALIIQVLGLDEVRAEELAHEAMTALAL